MVSPKYFGVKKCRPDRLTSYDLGMAEMINWVRRDGVRSFSVRWRQAGIAQRETFARGTSAQNERRALAFRAAVEANGNRWPEDWEPGRGTRVVDDEQTFAEFAAVYIDSRTELQPRVRLDYERKVEILREVEILGDGGRLYRPFHQPLTRITERDIKAWLSQWSRSPKTLSNYHGLISAIMAEAVYLKLIPANPCTRTGVSRRRVKEQAREVVPLTHEQYHVLLSLEKDETIRDLVAVTVLTGLRMGEVLALWAEDVDLDRAKLTVRKAWKRKGKDGEEAVPAQLSKRLKPKHVSGSGHYLGAPKSLRSKRTISLSDPAVEALRRQMRDKQPDDFIFSTGYDKPFHVANFINRKWQALARRAVSAGLPDLHFHDLRHTHASWLLNAGVPLSTIQARLGHESIQTTVDIYGHLMCGSDDGVTALLNEVAQPRLVEVPDAEAG